MSLKLNTLGRHILIEYYGCNETIINNNKLIEELMNKAAELSGATIVNSVFHYFNPHGVSGAVIIEESHLTIHTWPEYGYASVDIFTCGDTVNPWIAANFLEAQFKASKCESFEFPRGIKEKIENELKLELANFSVKGEGNE